MRNSSLVEGSCAENQPALKLAAESVEDQVQGRRLKPQRWTQWGTPLFGPSPTSVGVSPPAGEPGGETPGKGVGSLEYRLGVVGERSSGDEATM